MPWYGGKQIKTLPISLRLDPERVKRFCEVHVIPGAVFALCLQVPHPLQSVQLKAGDLQESMVQRSLMSWQSPNAVVCLLAIYQTSGREAVLVWL